MVLYLKIDPITLHRVVDRGRELGAQYVEARFQDDYRVSVSTRNDKVLAVTSSRRSGVGIRVLVNGSLGFASTNSTTLSDILEVIELAVSQAKATSKLRKKPIEFSDEKLGDGKYSVDEKRSLLGLNVEEMIKLAMEIYRAAKSSVKEAKLPFFLTDIRLHIQEKLVVTSDGARVESRVPRLYITSSLTIMHPQKGTLQRSIEFGGSGGAELVEKWNPVKTISEEQARLEKVLLRGVAPPSEKVPVVLGPEVVGLIAHESAGHPLEADRILGREAAQAGESYVKPEYIGSFRVGNRYATVIDDPTIPNSYGFFLYDDEGVKARPRFLYKEGLINEPLHNRHTARIFNTKSNGAARSMDYASEPIVRMSNTYIAPGDMDFDELIEDIDLGVYVKSYMEWNIDDVRWNQRYVGLEAYTIRKGELDEPVRNPVLEFTTGWFYSSILGVDKNLEFYPGTCGKGEPSQGVPVWFGGPNVKLSRMKIGVLS
jgi:TldD protein